MGRVWHTGTDGPSEKIGASRLRQLWAIFVRITTATFGRNADVTSVGGIRTTSDEGRRVVRFYDQVTPSGDVAEERDRWTDGEIPEALPNGFALNVPYAFPYAIFRTEKEMRTYPSSSSFIVAPRRNSHRAVYPVSGESAPKIQIPGRNVFPVGR